MTALNPIYGFVGRSCNATAMALSATYSGLSNVIQAALSLGNEDPTASHVAAYAEGLARKSLGLPSAERGYYHAEKLYAKSDSGLAFIPVWGMLFNKCGWACESFTGYDYVRDAYAAALGDTSVTGIVFDVDSFGGEVQGCMELADWMYEQRDTKPTMAIANANACSAGYALLSSAGRASAIESSYVGSVGVVLMHVDYSGMLEKMGIKVTLMYEGEHKVDGHPYEPLSKAVRAEWQADLVKIRERFAGVVARNRSMFVEDVLDTEARVYGGQDALDVGFVDAVESPMAAVSAFFNELSGSTTQEIAMATTDKPGAQPPEPKTEVVQQPAPTQTQAAPQPSASDERARIKAIQGCDEAKGRESLAAYLAFDTEMSVDGAKKLLAAAPQGAAVKGPLTEANPFEKAMAATGNPNVGADGAKVELDDTAMLLRDYAMASGHVPVKQ